MTDDVGVIAGKLTEGIARAICSERCAAFGEPACWVVDSGALTRKCAGDDEPDCLTLGTVAARTADYLLSLDEDT